MHQKNASKKYKQNLTYLARGSSGGVRELSSYARLACNLRTDLVEGVLRAVGAIGGGNRCLQRSWNAPKTCAGTFRRLVLSSGAANARRQIGI